MCEVKTMNKIRAVVDGLTARKSPFTAFSVKEELEENVPLSDVAVEVSKMYSLGLFPPGYVCQVVRGENGKPSPARFKVYYFSPEAELFNDKLYENHRGGVL